MQDGVERCDAPQDAIQVTPTGAEHIADSSENRHVPLQTGAFSGAAFADCAGLDSQLRLVVEEWPKLSERVRTSIVALVKAEVRE